MAIVFKTPKSTLNTTSKQIQNLGGNCPPCPEPVLEGKELNYTQNGEYTVTPEQGVDGFSSIDVTVNVPSVNNQDKTVSPSTSSQSVEADSGYSGLGTVTVNAVTSSIDANISAGNIKKDITILGVTGNYDPQPALASANIVPATSAQTITPPAGIDGYSRINVTAVTSSIDQNIAAGNIKDGVTILGVTGNYSGSTINNQNKTVSPSTSQQSISADQGYTGLGTVTVNAVTSSIDQNIAAGNIKDGVTILGVTGTYEGSGGCVDWASMGWNCQDVIDCRITADVAYTASVKDNNSWSNDQNLVFAPKQSNGSGEVFQKCGQLAFVPDFTFTGTNVSYRNTFSMCPALESVGSISCPNVTSSRDADSMFQNCSRLTYIKNIDMKNCRRGGSMFSGCWALKDVSLTNMEQMEDIETFLQNTAYITTIRSMSGLGKGFVDISSSPTYSGKEHTLDLSAQKYGLTKQSIMTVINDIVAPDDTNVNDATLKLKADSYALLDASDIAIATAKRWSVVSA